MSDKTLKPRVLKRRILSGILPLLGPESGDERFPRDRCSAIKRLRLHGSWNRTSTRPSFSESTEEAERKSTKFSFGFGCPRSSLIYDLSG